MNEQRARSSVPAYAWVILVVVFLASVAAPLNQFKAPPVMPLLIETFNLDLTAAGMLMSVFAMTGLILAIPAGFILQRFGPKAAGLAALSFLALGSTLGALAGTATVLLASRLIEGMGMGIIAVVGPAAIAMWFPAEKRGMAMGLWATWVPTGSIIMYNTAPALATSFAWQAVWWMSTAFTLVVLALFWLTFRAPAAHELAPGSAPMTGSPAHAASLGAAMANRHIWLLSLEFLCFNLVALAWGTFYPTYLNTVRGYTLASASSTTSLIMIATLLAAPLGGLLSDRIGSRKRMLVIPFIAMTVTLLFLFTASGWQIPALMILIGLVSGAIPTASFAAVPEVMAGPQLAGIGMAVLALGQNSGMFIGPVMFGKLLETMSWTAAGYWLIPVCVVGICAAWLVKVR